MKKTQTHNVNQSQVKNTSNKSILMFYIVGRLLKFKVLDYREKRRRYDKYTYWKKLTYLNRYYIFIVFRCR